MQLQINDTIFYNWKVHSVIGSGSFGTVYEIEREEFGRVYKAAAKVITIPDDTNEGLQLLKEGMTEGNTIEYYRSLVEDIISECDLMERMKGESHIVSYEDHYVEERKDGKQWTIYIRMELLTPLLSVIAEENGYLEKEKIIRIGMDICKGLEVCQQFNVVHRDVKLENIFVSDTGNFKLGDFGISKILEESECAVSQKGTKIYMAPEMFRGEKYDATVDIYSLGLVLYRLFNDNRAPFMPSYPKTIRLQDKEEALQRRLSGEMLPDPCNADAETAAVIKKACSFQRELRYQTPKEMRKAMECLVNHSEMVCFADIQEEKETGSKTIAVQNVLGYYSLKKSYNIKIKKMMKAMGCLLILSMIIIIASRNGQKIIADNIKKELCVPACDVLGQRMENDTEKIIEIGISAVEDELHKNWIIVPALTDLQEAEAKQVLLEAGYIKEEIGMTYEYSDEVPAGWIVSQSEEPSVQVRKGTNISIVVSLGKKPIWITKKKTQDSESDIIWRELE